MLSIENSFVRVEIAPDGSVLRVIDRKTGTFQESHSPFSFIYGDFYLYDLAEHAAPEITLSGDTVHIRFSRMRWWARFKGNTYVKPENGPDLRFAFEISLDGEEVVFRAFPVEGMDQEELQLLFPDSLFGWDPAESGGAVIPAGYGTRIGFPSAAVREIDIKLLAMPFCGFLRQKKAGFGIYVRSFADASASLSMHGEAGNAQFRISFTVNQPFASYERELRFRFFKPGATVCDLAFWYRGIVKREKRFVSLKEKIAADPEVENLVGAVIWKHNVYSQRTVPAGVEKTWSLYVPQAEQAEIEGKPGNWSAYEIFDRAKALGFDRVAVWNTGWNRYGFDAGYPTRLPVNPERGTPEEFAAAAAYGRKLSPGFTYGIHDNYIDSYPDSPEFKVSEMVTDPGGVPRKGGIWRGGRCCLMCTTQSLRYARRDLPKMAELLGRGSIYIDVMGCALRECRSAEHPASRREDLRCRREILKEVKRHFGALASELLPADCYADIADVGAYTAIGQKYEGVRSCYVPLWQLVYHDSVMNFTGEGFGAFGRTYLNYCAVYGMLPCSLDEKGLRLSRSLRSAYTAAMTDFRYLDDDCTVMCSRFEDGTVVAANNSGAPFVFGNAEIAPGEYEVFHDLPASPSEGHLY